MLESPALVFTSSYFGRINGIHLVMGICLGPGAYPASYTMGTVSFPGVNRPGRGVDHLPPTLKKE